MCPVHAEVVRHRLGTSKNAVVGATGDRWQSSEPQDRHRRNGSAAERDDAGEPRPHASGCAQRAARSRRLTWLTAARVDWPSASTLVAREDLGVAAGVSQAPGGR